MILAQIQFIDMGDDAVASESYLHPDTDPKVIANALLNVAVAMDPTILALIVYEAKAGLMEMNVVHCKFSPTALAEAFRDSADAVDAMPDPS